MDMKNIATNEEIRETNAAMRHVVQYVPTFVMAGQQFYRIVAPIGHPHFHSDMTMEGMREWGII